MKRVILKIIPALICGVVLTGCGGKEDDPETSSITSISVTVENGSAFASKIEDVMALLTDENAMVKTVKYGNGVFTIDLPATVNESYLKNVDGGYPALKISNKKVKGVSINIDAFQSGVCVGNFYHAKNSGIQTEALFVYVDGDVKITGSDSFTIINRDPYGSLLGEHTYNTTYNVSLKKGWNIIYFTETHSGPGFKTSTTETITTNVPDGMKWYFRNV